MYHTNTVLHYTLVPKIKILNIGLVVAYQTVQGHGIPQPPHLFPMTLLGSNCQKVFGNLLYNGIGRISRVNV